VTVLAAIGLLVLAGVIVALVASGGGSTNTASTAAGGTRTSEIESIHGGGIARVASFDLGSPAGSLSTAVTGGGGIWLSLPDRGEIARIETSTESKLVYPVGGRPTHLAAVAEGAWVAGSGAGPLARFRGADAVAKPSLASEPVALAANRTDGSVWAAEANGAVSHVAPNGATSGAGVLTPAPLAMGFGEGALWAVNGAAQGLVRIDPAAGAPTAFSVGAHPVSLTFDQGVWIANGDGQVTRFNPQPNKLNVNATLTTGAPELDAIAAVENHPSVWAISKQARTLYRISNEHMPAVTGTVVFASAPVALAAGNRFIWVATEDGRLIQLSGAGG
jgi:hypothetical protein